MKIKMNSDKLSLALPALALGTLGACSLPGGKLPDQNKPNIIVIYADDLDFDELGLYPNNEYPCYTGEYINGVYKKHGFPPNWDPYYYQDTVMHTPNIQKLASQGAVFSRFYITSPMCTPSRYSLLTGKYASCSPGFLEEYPAGSLANLQWNQPLLPGEDNLAKQLGRLGYTTGIVGKWHNDEPEAAFPHDIAKNAHPYDEEINQRLRDAQEKGKQFLTNDIGFSFADRIYFGNVERRPGPPEYSGHNINWTTEGAVHFIEQNKEKPFFLYYALNSPHGAYGYYVFLKNMLGTAQGMIDKVPECQPGIYDIVARLDSLGISPRNTMATWIDDAVGAILQKLEAEGLDENTIVIFTSDHQSRGKSYCYEGARVPFVIKWPGKIKPGTRVEKLAANIDIAPTFIEIAGGKVPGDMNGRSMLPLFENNGPGNWREYVLLETGYEKAVVTESYKYIACRPPAEVVKKMRADSVQSVKNNTRRIIGWDGRKGKTHDNTGGVRFDVDVDFPCYFDADQLYSLEKDVFEQNNLAADSLEILEIMKGYLAEVLHEIPHVFGEFKTND